MIRSVALDYPAWQKELIEVCAASWDDEKRVYTQVPFWQRSVSILIRVLTPAIAFLSVCRTWPRYSPSPMRSRSA